MIELASALTLPIAKLLLKSWLGDSVAVDIGDNLLKLGFNRFGDWAKARAARQQADRIAGAIVKDLGDFFARERVDEDTLLPAAFELGETIRSHVDAAFLVNQSLHAGAIAKALLDARPLDGIYGRAEPEHGLYVRLVEALAPRLRALAPEQPDFARERDAVILQKLDGVAAAAPRLLEELRGVHEKLDELRERPARLAQGFERDYLDAVVKELDYVEILGIEELDSKSRRADLTVAYLSLTARLGEGDDQQKIDFATVLTLLPLLGNRLWIEGGAGSGKSTLVRWAALQAARWRLGQVDSSDVLEIAPDLDNWLNFLWPARADERGPRDDAEGARLRPSPAHRLRRADEEHPAKGKLREQAWRQRLPFVAFLRYAPDGLTLIELPHLTVHTIVTPPEGWLQEAFSNGGAGILLIFDGVDEIPVGRKREHVLEQIKDFIDRFPDAQIIVTSRPGAADSASADGFRKVVLEDLSEQQKLGFIDHWHRALATNFRREHDDGVVTKLGEAALRELKRQPTLARLATNPLLCSAICALHWLSRRKVVEEAWLNGSLSPGSMQTGVLPGSLWNLCEQLTRMLVHQRDLDRKLDGTAFGPAYCLSYELKREILARIAYGMVAGDLLSAMAREDTVAHVRQALEGFRDSVGASAEEVLRALLERSGVLRGSGEDAVEFVHNTIKAFLAAKFYLGLLTHDEVVRRVAAGTPEEMASGLDEIAVFAAASPDHPVYAQRLIEALLCARPVARKLGLLALRCEAVASSHLPQATRGEVRRLTKRLFPPRDSLEARQLAALGNEAVARLSYRRNAKAAASAAAAHCLRLIGTDKAREHLRVYLATESLVVAEELIHDFNPLEITSVRKATAAYDTWGDVSPIIKSAVRDLTPVAKLTHLQTLYLNGTQVADAAPLANLINLQRLGLSQTYIDDATPLADLIKLLWLDLSETQVADATPLAKLTNPRYLYLHGTKVEDLAPLGNLTKLQCLYIYKTLAKDLAPLANLSGLTELSFFGTPVTDLSPIANLTKLRSLTLGGVPVNDAAALTNLTSLRELTLWHTQVSDPRPLSNLANLRALDLSATLVAEVAPLANLTNLRSLDLTGTRVSREQVTELKRALAERGNCSVTVVGP